VTWHRTRARVGYTRYDLPSFDAYAYVTMADNPRFFTVAPWGYRILQPLLASGFPARERLAVLRDTTLVALVAAGGLLFLFLRRLGFSEPAALLGAAAFALSGPTRHAIGSPLLGDGTVAALEAAALLAIQSGASLLVVGALLAAGVFTKEIFLLMPPLVFLARRHSLGPRRALRDALLAALPAYAVFLLLRFHWTPFIDVAHPAWNLDLARAGVTVFESGLQSNLLILLLGGLLPLAALGALRRAARPYLLRFGYWALLMPLAAVFAWINVPGSYPVPLFGSNMERLLIYSLPVLIPLALLALDRFWPNLGPAAAARPTGRAARGLAVVTIGAALAYPLVGLDRYRRLPLHEVRDGPLVMAFCGESIRSARKLERGEEVEWSADEKRFAWGISDPGQLFQMRWFLRQGFGPLPHYGVDEIVMREARATLVLPLLRPRDLELELELESPRPVSVALAVNGRPSGQRVSLPIGRARHAVKLGGPLLFRGDNVLELLADPGSLAGVKLHSLLIRASARP
jgi:hypothetical protein